MRRSFGSGRNMGGSGGSGMIRSVQRAVRAGVGGAPPEPFSSSAATTTRKAESFNNKQPTSPTTALTLSSAANNGASAFSSLINLPMSSSSSTTCSDESDWEYVDGIEDGRARVFYEDHVFGTLPSTDEVHHALSALQQVVDPYEVGSVKQICSEIDWVEPSPHLCYSKMLELHSGSDRSVYDAFHLLETEPSVQRMVVSLSSDRAVWDAVLNNEVVKELRGSISQKGTEEEGSDKGCDEPNPVKDILGWIVVNGKAKIVQLIDNIMTLVNGAFGPLNEEKKRRFKG